MAPEIVIAVITAVSVLGAAVVAVVPTLMTAHKRTRTAVGHVEESVQEQGAETRAATIEALDAVGTRLEARFNARVDDLRDDIDDIREDITRVREWQAGHDAEHIISRPRTGGGDA
ncbi:hypothetical protein [Streptomyces fulvorobeus]|uniref:Uncharacterized protein n=1 Tax=Streptomyces fulvorobeus TaxID=284028 RepID=A0A7J0CDY5_9ACTN|nr:hypothetical protein [Streptomyces fulvorobeus]NYE44209.1 hypothetical protein [Streptomyces fulvorobeus]GFN00723.1 hypothetical protein Sfulv_55330 [Streptomyces fulvorobeus]